jgi:carbamoyltransferase
MIVLGVCDGHDAGACVAQDGRILAAISEERITRIKRKPGFPYNSIARALRIAGLTPGNVDKVAVTEIAGRSIHRLLNGIYTNTNPNLPLNRPFNRISAAAQNFIVSGGPIRAVDAALSTRVISSRLRKMGFVAPLHMIDHHYAHAASAAFGSGFDEALVVTMDAFGDGCAGGAWRWEADELKPLVKLHFPVSPSLLYGRVTSLLGFCEGEEGQVAALAASGDPKATKKNFDEFFAFDEGRLTLQKNPTPSRLAQMLQGKSDADIAAGLQACVEDMLTGFIAYWMKNTGAKKLCLAGGLFANVRLNQIIAAHCGCRDLYVFVHMGDGGLCVGAAWAMSGKIIRREIFDPFTGLEAQELERSDVSSLDAVIEDLNDKQIEKIAAAVDEGKTIGVVTGRMEFGPRALGNRSILFSARRPDVAVAIGRALERPEIMPFAPVVRAEDFDEFTSSPMFSAFRHMTVTAQAKPEVASQYPTAVHVDASMRMQIVGKDSSPLIHKILTAYAKHASPPLLINTSFNMHGEPIIAKTKRAHQFFMQTPLSALIVGGQCFWKLR